MKKLFLVIALFVTLSLTLDKGSNDPRVSGSSGVLLNVPAQPKFTVYVQGIDKMNKYLKKGFQVQEVKDYGSSNSNNHFFLMVKY
jgi:hypothetical protein